MIIFNKNYKIPFSTILFIVLIGIALEETINTNKNNFQFYLKDSSCPEGTSTCYTLGGICVPVSECPSPLFCPEDYLNINLYSCGLEPKFAPESQCLLNHECWDNTCVTNPSEKLSQCPTLTSCPEKKIKCFDNSCVNSLEDCPNYYECPSFLPIRCPNGDCRQSLEDCPSIVTCPKKLPILCNDGSCHILKSNCEYSSEETQCSDTSMVRCPDGSCTSSKSLCSTPMTCPIGYQKCYNGLCKKIGECYNITIQSLSSTCNDEKKVLCNFDFSCRNDITSCPTGIICPADKPVKCWDNSCKENINQCPKYQNCPELMKECPDGSCTSDKCGTHITCSIEAPFRCFDNTCKRNPEDCPQMPSCPSDKPILCWDGRCLADRGECLSPSICETSSPVKCPDGLCFQTGDSCKSIEDCPAEFIKCPDGTCMKSNKDCNSKECPLNFPYRCKNGICVSKQEYCEKDNGCPWNKQYKCSNGQCVEKEKECNNNNPCTIDKRRCPDGSCLPINVKCPAESGCSVDSPIKCADGSCIKNNEKEKCPIPICPSSQPYRCVNGLCVSTISACPSEYKHSEEDPKLVICADSTLAHFFDECKPVFDCMGINTVRCGDGSCRSDILYCPMENSTHYLDTCPEGTVRCENGGCSNKEGLCLLSNGCYQSSENQYKCISNGACVKDEDECEELSLKYNLANGCPNEYPIKCPITQKCVITESDCDNYEKGCDPGKIMCPNGDCVSRIVDCPEDEYDCTYGDNGRNFTCNKESEAVCADEFRHCYNKENCQIDSPFRCISGNCKKYPYSLLALEKENINNNEYCEIGIQCPEYKPYLCLDGSCVEKTSFCKSLEPCPEGKQYRCFDRTCESSQRICETRHNKCPGSNPILCPNGNCVSNIVDCFDTTCPPWYPYKCITGSCERIPGECLLQETIYEDNEEEEEDDDDDNEEEDVGINIYGNICNEDEFLCIDGTCRKNENECPLYEGCTKLSKPFKCSDGSCAISLDDCNLNSSFLNCTNNTILCQDGLCRKECPEFNGCPNEKPLMCSNGHCVSSLPECAGYSSCISTSNPFRCADGSCAPKLSDCKTILREFGATNIVLMTYPHLEINVPIVIGELNLHLASLDVPSDTFFSENESIESRIFINSVPKSKYNKTYCMYDKTRYDDVVLVYPYSDPTHSYKLDYEYAILSTVINITAEKRTLYEDKKDIVWNNNLILTILYDFPYKHEGIVERKVINKKRYSSMPLDKLTDICLGKLEEETGLWKCIGLSQEAKSYNNLQLKASFNSSGIYAVILNPKQNTNELNIEYNFFFRYFLPITLIILIILLILGILCYIFTRIYRYRIKYKATKKAYASTNIEFNRLGVRQSKIQGETLADQEDGVIWTQNPTYKNSINDDNINTRHLEDMRDKLTKKLKALERNNRTLQEQTENMRNEIQRLKDYKAELANNDI